MDEKTIDKTVVEDAWADTTHTPSARHSSRSRSSRSSSDLHKVSRRLALTVALFVSVLALLFVIIFSFIRISGLEEQNEVLQAELTKTRQELSQTGPELERTRKIISEMTKGRLPHLLDLVPDKVLQINGPYLKNIVFTVLNQNGTKSYEYKLVMENSTAKSVRPAARIFVFDRYGVQIGSAEVAGRAELASGESRSQSSAIDRFIDEEPRYFYVSTLPADKPPAGHIQ
jgi:cell division protein FtsB